VPGWDCHGLPIEHKITSDLGSKAREMSTLEIRKLCSDYAHKYVKIQSQQFQRLGILGEWENPYLTMSPEYEAQLLEVFARFVETGLVYKKLKPVPWSVANQTALADAELEYKDVEDPSVYVEFPLLKRGRGSLSAGMDHHALDIARESRGGGAFGRDVRARGATSATAMSAVGIIAAELVEKVFKLAAIESFEVVGTTTGKELLNTEYRHPFIDRTGKVLAADDVTTTDGTGLVHTAPGHGEEDFETGVRNGLDTYSPVMANGRF